MKALIRPAVKSAARLSLVRRGLIAYHDRRLTAGDWARPHPFDREHGIETSGCVPGYLIQADVRNYSGSQPSIVRRALEQIPGPERYALVDLGCGKGRVLAVASELPFRRVVGVELSPILAKAARRNAGVLARRYPARTRIEVAVADAATFRLPDGPVVVLFCSTPSARRRRGGWSRTSRPTWPVRTATSTSSPTIRPRARCSTPHRTCGAGAPT